MSGEGVCRTAPATQGLLNALYDLSTQNLYRLAILAETSSKTWMTFFIPNSGKQQRRCPIRSQLSAKACPDN